MNQTLDEKNILANPFEQFALWFSDAQTAKVPKYEAMALATATAEGIPSVRMVLYKGIEQNGFIFFTNYHSRKANEIETNPHGALLFHWVELERQVRLEGSIERLNRQAAEKYFATRPRESQLGAWASKQSSILESREPLEQALQQYQKIYEGNNIPLPEFWGGYRLLPTSFEFWQGQPRRLHDRIRYAKHDSCWRIERLAP
jgi:pyridoxamine 5'-phosphate oxidase